MGCTFFLPHTRIKKKKKNKVIISSEKFMFAHIFQRSDLILSWTPGFVKEITFSHLLQIIPNYRSQGSYVSQVCSKNVQEYIHVFKSLYLLRMISPTHYSWWAFSGQAQSLSQTLKQPAEKLLALLSYHPLCSDMVTKKINCFEGCGHKTHQGNGRKTESGKNTMDIPTCAEKLSTRLGKDRTKGFI